MTKPNSPAAERNKNAILQVISEEFRDCKTILEVGSGTGQHAVYFAANMPWLTWQTSDRPTCHVDIHSWLDDAGLDNVIAPMELDVEKPNRYDIRFDAVFSANTAHIMSIAAVERMFELVGGCLTSGGKFCLYGPFNQDGAFTSDSNRNFDANLKSQDPVMGIRDLESLHDFALANGLQQANLYAMPANNMIAVWIRQ